MSGTMPTVARFLAACRRQRSDTTPIWLMRQAGRYMPEYRALREKYTILEIIRTPELACQVTLQPIRAFALDAAIIFADILPPLVGMGLELEFVAGDGPVIRNPIRSSADVDALRVQPPEETLGFTLEAIRLARRELDGLGIPLIGFSGAPFTLAAYAVEGGSSPYFVAARRLMMADPATWHKLMAKLGEVVGCYLLAQAQAGAQALQLFDSWAGQLNPDDYRELVLPYTRRALAIAGQAGVPIIHFGTNTAGMLDLLKEAGSALPASAPLVIGVDWRISLDRAWQQLGPDVAVQGNLDPLALLAPWDELRRRARRVLDAGRAVGRPGHIFNLGHGILQDTPPDNVRRLVDFVHEYGQRSVA